jgi:hypothetical protein
MKCTCFECNQEHPFHKMGCSSKSRMDTLAWLMDSLQYMPDDLIAQISFACYVEQLERKTGFQA